MKKPKAVFFDMGGVLFDTTDRWDSRQFAISFQDGLPEGTSFEWFLGLSNEIWKTCINRPAPRIPLNTRPIISTWLNKSQIHPASDEVEKWLEILCNWEASPVYEFAYPSLRSLRNMDIRLGLISNTFLPGIGGRRNLEKAKILDLFEVSVFSAEVGYSKPDPRIFHHALKAMNLAPEDSWYVGDKPNRDICGANRVGMTSVLVDSRYHDQIADAKENIPDLKIGTIADLPRVLQDLVNGSH